jgi:glutaredoxin
MFTVTLYTRKDCHLCDQAKSDLESLQSKHPHRLVEIDIDSDPALQKKYLVEIPVVEVGPYVLKAPFDKQKLMMTLGAAGDRRGQLDRLGRLTITTASAAGRVSAAATGRCTGSPAITWP